MDVLNQLLKQINDLFKSMSPGARMTAGLLFVAVVVAVGYLFTAQQSGADAFLLNGQSFTADEMSTMEAAFGKASLSDYTVEGSRIRVTRSRQAAFMGALADSNALPARFGDYLSRASSSVGAFTSREQREEMLKVAKQQELALIIRSMQGIESAAVHYDTQKKSSGLRSEQAVTASVSVRPRGLQPLDESKVPMIRSLVASAIAGLQPDNVTVVDLVAGRAYGGKSGGMGSALDDPYLSRTKEYQQMTEAMIRDALSYVPGVNVTANVELDREMMHNSEKMEIDPKTVPITQETEENTLTSKSGGGPQGPPGLGSQQPGGGNNANAAARLAGGGGSTSTEDSRTKDKKVLAASHGRTTTQMAGLTPKRTTVAVGIPSDYFEKVWVQRNPAAEGEDAKKPDAAELATIQQEETKKIREHVASLIKLPVDPSGAPIDPTTLVTVNTFSRVALPSPLEVSMPNRALDWLMQSWSTVAMIGLAFFALLMLRSFVSAVPAAPEMPSFASTTVSDEEESHGRAGGGAAAAAGPGGDAKPKQRTLQRKVGTGPSLRDELVEMVREDADAAANVSRGRIGNMS